MKMNLFIQSARQSGWRRGVCALLVLSLFVTMVLSPAALYAAESGPAGLALPRPGVLLPRSPAFVPAMIRGLTIYPDHPLQFDFIVDPGDEDLDAAAFEAEAQRQIKYFLAALTVPEDDLWVNLSPYEGERIIPAGLGTTEMGRDMLAQDYLLKQLTASLLYPEEELGREFWRRVYARARDQYGLTEIPVSTFNKVWVVPDAAAVYEHQGSAFVVERHLKVMLDADYRAAVDAAVPGHPSAGPDAAGALAAQVVREVILPEIEAEVNAGATFARLRQIYNGLILAAWYKKRLRQGLLGQVYMDQNKTRGIDLRDPAQVREAIYTQYLEAFRQGVYNYIREDLDPATGTVVPRKYFSGGLQMGAGAARADVLTVYTDPADLPQPMSSAIGQGRPGTKVVTTALVENQHGGEARAPDQAAGLLAMTRDWWRRQQIKLTLPLLGRGNALERIRAVERLRQLGATAEDFFQGYVRAFIHPDSEAKAAAADELGRMGDDRAVPVLRGRVQDPSYAALRRNILVALGRIGGDDVLPVLIARMADPELRAASVEALLVMSGEAIDPEATVLDKIAVIDQLLRDRAGGDRSLRYRFYLLAAFPNAAPDSLPTSLPSDRPLYQDIELIQQLTAQDPQRFTIARQALELLDAGEEALRHFDWTVALHHPDLAVVREMMKQLAETMNAGQIFSLTQARLEREEDVFMRQGMKDQMLRLFSPKEILPLALRTLQGLNPSADFVDLIVRYGSREQIQAAADGLADEQAKLKAYLNEQAASWDGTFPSGDAAGLFFGPEDRPSEAAAGSSPIRLTGIFPAINREGRIKKLLPQLGYADPGQRDAAVETLRKLGATDEHFIAGYSAVVRDSDLSPGARQEAVKRLGELLALDPLIEALSDPDLRETVIEQFLDLADLDLLDLMMPVSDQDKLVFAARFMEGTLENNGRKQEFYFRAAFPGQPYPHPLTAADIVRLIAVDQRYVKVADQALTLLGATPDQRDAFNRVIVARHSDPDMVLSAVKKLSHLGPSTLLDLVLSRVRTDADFNFGGTFKDYLPLVFDDKDAFIGLAIQRLTQTTGEREQSFLRGMVLASGTAEQIARLTPSGQDPVPASRVQAPVIPPQIEPVADTGTDDVLPDPDLVLVSSPVGAWLAPIPAYQPLAGALDLSPAERLSSSSPIEIEGLWQTWQMVSLLQHMPWSVLQDVLLDSGLPVGLIDSVFKYGDLTIFFFLLSKWGHSKDNGEEVLSDPGESLHLSGPWALFGSRGRDFVLSRLSSDSYQTRRSWDKVFSMTGVAPRDLARIYQWLFYQETLPLETRADILNFLAILPPASIDITSEELVEMVRMAFAATGLDSWQMRWSAIALMSNHFVGAPPEDIEQIMSVVERLLQVMIHGYDYDVYDKVAQLYPKAIEIIRRGGVFAVRYIPRQEAKDGETEIFVSSDQSILVPDDRPAQPDDVVLLEVKADAPAPAPGADGRELIAVFGEPAVREAEDFVSRFLAEPDVSRRIALWNQHLQGSGPRPTVVWQQRLLAVLNDGGTGIDGRFRALHGLSLLLSGDSSLAGVFQGLLVNGRENMRLREQAYYVLSKQGGDGELTPDLRRVTDQLAGMLRARGLKEFDKVLVALLPDAWRFAQSGQEFVVGETVNRREGDPTGATSFYFVQAKDSGPDASSSPVLSPQAAHPGALRGAMAQGLTVARGEVTWLHESDTGVVSSPLGPDWVTPATVFAAGWLGTKGLAALWRRSTVRGNIQRLDEAYPLKQRLAAIEFLGWSQDDRALRPLLDLLGDGSDKIRRAARSALDRLGVGEARLARGYLQALRSLSREAKAEARAALTGLPEEHGYQLLEKALLHGPNDSSWVTVVDLLVELGDARAVVPLANVLFFSESPRQRYVAGQAIQRLGTPAQLYDAYRRALKESSSTRVRALAAREMGQLRGAEGFPVVDDLLDSLSDRAPVRAAVIDTILRLFSDSPAPAANEHAKLARIADALREVTQKRKQYADVVLYNFYFKAAFPEQSFLDGFMAQAGFGSRIQNKRLAFPSEAWRRRQDAQVIINLLSREARFPEFAEQALLLLSPSKGQLIDFYKGVLVNTTQDDAIDHALRELAQAGVSQEEIEGVIQRRNTTGIFKHTSMRRPADLPAVHSPDGVVSETSTARPEEEADRTLNSLLGTFPGLPEPASSPIPGLEAAAQYLPLVGALEREGLVLSSSPVELEGLRPLLHLAGSLDDLLFRYAFFQAQTALQEMGLSPRFIGEGLLLGQLGFSLWLARKIGQDSVRQDRTPAEPVAAEGDREPRYSFSEYGELFVLTRLGGDSHRLRRFWEYAFSKLALSREDLIGAYLELYAQSTLPAAIRADILRRLAALRFEYVDDLAVAALSTTDDASRPLRMAAIENLSIYPPDDHAVLQLIDWLKDSVPPGDSYDRAQKVADFVHVAWGWTQEGLIYQRDFQLRYIPAAGTGQGDDVVLERVVSGETRRRPGSTRREWIAAFGELRVDRALALVKGIFEPQDQESLNWSIAIYANEGLPPAILLQSLEEALQDPRFVARYSQLGQIKRQAEEWAQSLSSGQVLSSSPVAMDRADRDRGDQDVGGVDFRMRQLDLQIRRDADGVPLPLPQQPVGEMRIEGFLPVIINIAPANVPLLLGLADTAERAADGGDARTDAPAAADRARHRADPADHRQRLLSALN